MLLLSKTTEKELATLQKIADKNNALIEMRDKYGILLAIGTSINALTEIKNKEGKPLYKVESIKKLNYDQVVDQITFDIQLDIYKGKKELKFKNPKTQDFFNKQEVYWDFMVNRWNNTSSNLLLGSDCIINKIKN
jgi:hypothetical protein